MEQNLIQTSRIRISSLSIDSRFADQNYGSPPDTSEFLIRLPSTLRNIMRIRLSSVEIPPTEYVFSEDKGNVTLGVSGEPLVSIPAGNYTVGALCTAVKSALGGSYDCSFNTITGRVTITAPSDFTLFCGSQDEKISARKTDWGLGYFLGIRIPYITDKSVPPEERRAIASVNKKIVAYAPPLVCASPYYLLQLQCPDQLENVTHRVSANTSVPAFAKLIFKNDTYCIETDDNSNLVRKEYTFLAPTNISQLRVKLVDPFGLPVRLYTADWSMTFEVTEVVNTHTYDKLNMTYNS